MLGFYDYTTILTYLSLLSACTGIVLSLAGSGHPFLACFCLLLCGFCDAFDGKVARTKKGRTRMECDYGIQIDSLSDLVAFGVLPACMGGALILDSPFLQGLAEQYRDRWFFVIGALILFAILLLYVLAAMIRLAWFNITEEERQRTEGGVRKYYTGLPVTSAALIFPVVMLLQYLTTADISLVYIAVALITGGAFVSRLQIPKPGLRGILIMIAAGLVIVAVMVLALSLRPATLQFLNIFISH
ncbi:MAG: CDP-alcohol phosphatidyltransferase family protein [Clostridia bacterium]|nr:CDP-alcohol phosphatidyltransferase family protein [Clostridia bacterium]